MKTFEEFKLSKQLNNALIDLGFNQPTPIQEESFPVIMSGKDVVGIAQTGTGKTLAYMLPILQDLKFSQQLQPRVLILVPTRELVIQIVEHIKVITSYINVRVLGVYGGTNINTQKLAVSEGLDILVATPRRCYDLAISKVLRLNSIKKLVIDEVDIMLDFGYKTQLLNIFDYIPKKRQNLMFSATMTEFVDQLMEDFLVNPAKISIAVSGTPLDKISQACYSAPNFYSKLNLLNHLMKDKSEYRKVLIFVGTKVAANRLFEELQKSFGIEVSVIHSSKEQNQRTKSIEKFEDGTCRILVATDVIARGIDVEKISTVINFDTPHYPENYIHRIGRTGRAGEEGNSLLFYTEKEEEKKVAIEELMQYEIPLIEWPEEVQTSAQLVPEERNKPVDKEIPIHKIDVDGPGAAYHEKSAKNSQVNEGGKYRRELAEKYKKPQRRGDKIQNMKKKNRKK